MFNKKQKLTMFEISGLGKRTVKREIIIVSAEEGRIVYQPKGKRKRYYLALTPEIMLFDGHVLPFGTDIERGHSQPVGVYCLVGKDKEEVRKFVAVNQINPAFNCWADITFLPAHAPALTPMENLYETGEVWQLLNNKSI